MQGRTRHMNKTLRRARSEVSTQDLKERSEAKETKDQKGEIDSKNS